MNKKSFWVAFIIGFTLLFFGVKYFLAQSTQDRIMNDMIAGFTLAEQDLNAKLPLRIDEKTTLLRVKADGAVFTYEYAVNDVENTGDKSALIATFRSFVAPSVCNRVDMVRFMGYGARYVYSYSFEDGEVIGSFAFTKIECPAAFQP